jgi:hypothetical protein
VGRDDVLARLLRWVPSPSRTTARVGAIVLGWLVLMTIWGWGRAVHGDLAPRELTVGLVAGAVTAVIAWRAAGRR